MKIRRSSWRKIDLKFSQKKKKKRNSFDERASFYAMVSHQNWDIRSERGGKSHACTLNNANTAPTGLPPPLAKTAESGSIRRCRGKLNFSIYAYNPVIDESIRKKRNFSSKNYYSTIIIRDSSRSNSFWLVKWRNKKCNNLCAIKRVSIVTKLLKGG